MGGLALLFPGQASQFVGMGAAMRHAFPPAAALFARADTITGLPITHLTEHGPLDRLTATEIAQPAVVTTSIAALQFLHAHLGTALTPRAVAGHSVGEFAAYYAAGVFDESAAIALVHARAQAMARACAVQPGVMAAVLALDVERLEHICSESSFPGSRVEVANDNAPGQVVISGEREAVKRASDAALSAGARRVIPLNVGGAFHSTCMQPAAEALRAAVNRTRLQSAKVDVVLNVSAMVARGSAELAEELCAQVVSAVRWAESLRHMQALDCDRFIEVGPGEVLAGMVKRTLPGARVVSFGAPESLTAVEALLA